MASTAGLSSWEKYFKGKGDFDCLLKRDVTLKPNSARGTAISVSKGTTVKFLGSLVKTRADYLSYAPSVKKGQSVSPKINAWIPVQYERKQYLCDMDSLAKPVKSGNIDLALQTSNLLESATSKKMDIFGHVDIDSAVFTRASDLAESAKTYISGNKLLDAYPNLKKSLQKYFDSGDYASIKWVGPITDFEIAQFSKYIGEVCIGLVLLSGETSALTGKSPFVGKRLKRMIYPLSQSFKGADSVAELMDGTMIPISSKADEGAAASFFGNLFMSVIENSKYRPARSVMKKIYDAAMAVQVNSEITLKTGVKKIIYEYGIRNIVGLDQNVVPDTYQVFSEFKKFNKITQYSPSVRKAYAAIEAKMIAEGDELAVQKLDESTTVFFCKMIAKDMNADKATIKVMENLLGQKSYYQVNLDVSKVKKGTLTFNVVESGGGSVVMIGNKSSYNNIDASQGTISYRIK
jgi:hypothetical protein